MDEDFEQALTRTRNPVLVANDERYYVGANDAALHLFGVTREELLRHRVDDLFVPAQGEDLDELWDAFLQRGGQTGHGTFRRPAGGQVLLRYGAVARVAPGRHLSIFFVEAEDGDGPAEPVHVLTAREREVIALAAHGNTTREIAERLVVSPTTVDTHIRSAMERLGARNRVHAVALALARGEVVFAAED
jgi:PAS domain S-box-containing protein